MKRIQRVLVVTIISLVMLGCGMTTAVSAVKPPFMPPAYEGYPGYPDAAIIVPSFVIDSNPYYPNRFYESDASFIIAGWVYYVDPLEPVDERELFPQPIRIQVWIKSPGGDWSEVKLSRYALGNAADIYDDPHYVGPILRWYAYFEPYTFDVGVYETHISYTCKDPDNPSQRMFCWDTDPTSPTFGQDLNWYGTFLVQEG